MFLAKEVNLVLVDRLLPYARNTRTHSDDQVAALAASIREFGFTNPVLVREDGTIVAGHGRVLAARKLGISEVPCINVGHLSEAQARAYVIADNKLAEQAGWDDELLKLEVADLAAEGFDMTLIGFDSSELEGLLAASVAGTSGLTDQDAIPEPPIDPASRVGDVWLLGAHRLMCGDSTDASTVATLMAGALADQLITDPPYNVGYTGKTKDALKIQNDEMSNDSFRAFLRAAFAAANGVMKPGAVFYVWHADSDGYNFRGACLDAGWQVRQCVVWKKQTFVLGRQDYHWQHEPCLYGWKDGAAHLWSSDRKQTTILEFNRPTRNDIHPTMKPVDLIEYQVLNNTKGADIVLDLFGGGGQHPNRLRENRPLRAADGTGPQVRRRHRSPLAGIHRAGGHARIRWSILCRRFPGAEGLN